MSTTLSTSKNVCGLDQILKELKVFLTTSLNPTLITVKLCDVRMNTQCGVAQYRMGNPVLCQIRAVTSPDTSAVSGTESLGSCVCS